MTTIGFIGNRTFGGQRVAADRKYINRIPARREIDLPDRLQICMYRGRATDTRGNGNVLALVRPQKRHRLADTPEPSFCDHRTLPLRASTARNQPSRCRRRRHVARGARTPLMVMKSSGIDHTRWPVSRIPGDELAPFVPAPGGMRCMSMPSYGVPGM